MSNATKAEDDSSNKITTCTAGNKGTVLLQTASCESSANPMMSFCRERVEAERDLVTIFSDASQQAYAATVYLRSEWDDSCVQVELVASKTKVAPLKKQSILHLELLGTTILARLMNTVQTSLPSEIKIFYWTDFTTALCWITNNKPWKRYVQHRVQEIQQLSPKKSWRYCLGPENLQTYHQEALTETI